VRGGDNRTGELFSYVDLRDAMLRIGVGPVVTVLTKKIYQILFKGRRFVSAAHFVAVVLGKLRRRERRNVVGLILPAFRQDGRADKF